LRLVMGQFEFLARGMGFQPMRVIWKRRCSGTEEHEHSCPRVASTGRKPVPRVKNSNWPSILRLGGSMPAGGRTLRLVQVQRQVNLPLVMGLVPGEQRDRLGDAALGVVRAG